MIHFAQTPNGAIKIGTTEHPDGRLAGLESYYGQPLALLAAFAKTMVIKALRNKEGSK